jgi:hypothetical protein
LAETLSDGKPISIKSDLQTSCIEHRIEYLVTKKMTGFDLVPLIVPNGIDFDRVRSVTAAVADGPHSPLAVAVAESIGLSRGIPVSVATAFHSNEDRDIAIDRLDRLVDDDEMEQIVVASDNASAIVEDLHDSALLVIGAPGGSWFQRQLYGPGHKLVVGAPAGAVLVRSAPRRCFAEAADATAVAVSPHLPTTEARRVMIHPVAPVADEGRLVGVLRASALAATDTATSVGDLMEPPVSVNATEPIEAASDLETFLDGGPIPVIDDSERLIGVIHIATDVGSPSGG